MILQGMLNRLLAHCSAAGAMLVPLAGRNVRIETPLKSAMLVITDDGRFGRSGATAEATLKLPLSFFIIRTHNPAAAAGQIEYSGDVVLGGLVGEALAQLRWDTADELSSLVGDMLAHRLAKFAGVVGGIPGAIGGRSLKNYAEYWRDENPLLPKAEEVERWQCEVARLRADLERAEQRIRKIEAQGQD